MKTIKSMPWFAVAVALFASICEFWITLLKWSGAWMFGPYLGFIEHSEWKITLKWIVLLIIITLTLNNIFGVTAWKAFLLSFTWLPGIALIFGIPLAGVTARFAYKSKLTSFRASLPQAA
jgi:hypothetical protein